MVQCGQVPGGAGDGALSEAELSEYCRRKGIQPEQIRQWRAACEQAEYAPAPGTDTVWREPVLIAAFMPDAEWAVSRHRPNLSRSVKALRF